MPIDNAILFCQAYWKYLLIAKNDMSAWEVPSVIHNLEVDILSLLRQSFLFTIYHALQNIWECYKSFFQTIILYRSPCHYLCILSSISIYRCILRNMTRSVFAYCSIRKTCVIEFILTDCGNYAFTDEIYFFDIPKSKVTFSHIWI